MFSVLHASLFDFISWSYINIFFCGGDFEIYDSSMKYIHGNVYQIPIPQDLIKNSIGLDMISRKLPMYNFCKLHEK